MTIWIDSFAHDVFPTVRHFQAYAFRRRPIMKMLQGAKAQGVGKTYGYPTLQQAAISQGTTRAAVQTQQVVADADFAGEEFTVGYKRYKGGFILDDFNQALTEGAGGVPNGAYAEEATIKYTQFSDEFGQRMEIYFAGRGGRSLARMKAQGNVTDFGNGIIAVKNRFDIMNFRRGQLLQFSTSDGNGSGSVVAGVFRVTTINTEAGTMTIVAESSSLAALETAMSSTENFAFNNSDFQGATPTLPDGFQDWITSTPATTTFNGVDRSVDSRLSGFRVSVATGAQVDTVAEDGLMEARDLYGASGDYKICVSSKRWRQFSDLAKAKGYRMLDGQTAIGGYRAIQIVVGDMEAEVIACPVLSDDDMFFLDMSGWVVRYAGKGWPRLLNGDGLKCLRLTDDDNYECRYNSIYHFGCRNVNHQGRADLSGISL